VTSWGVRGDVSSYPAQKGQLITAHIIDYRLRKPSSSQSQVIAFTMQATPPLGVTSALPRCKASTDLTSILLPT